MKDKMHNKWQMEDDVRLMKNFAGLMSEPKRVKAAQNMAKKELGMLEKVAEGKILGAKD